MTAPLLVLLLLLSASHASAQEPGRVYRLGVLSPASRGLDTLQAVTVPELARAGFVEGRNLAIYFRAGAVAELPGLAKDLVALRPDAIVAFTSDGAVAAREATSSVPIILYGGDDPVALGLAGSFARPGGNVTGLTIMSVGLDAKRLQVLHNARPGARRIAVLVHPGYANQKVSLRGMQTLAVEADFELIEALATGRDDYAAAFSAMRAAGAEALAITATSTFFNDARILIQLAAEARLPTMCEWREMAEAGCLLSYGPDRMDLYRRLAGYAAQVFRGANPADLPIEQPAVFELVLNLKTAKALGLDIPPALLAQADHVIE